MRNTLASEGECWYLGIKHDGNPSTAYRSHVNKCQDGVCVEEFCSSYYLDSRGMWKCFTILELLGGFEASCHHVSTPSVLASKLISPPNRLLH